MNDPALILIVEDNAGSLELTAVVLEADGFAAIGATSAEEARQLVHTRRPDLILMDIELPGMDGDEFTRELKDDPRTASIPVVALSAHAMSARAAATGFDGYIVKPWTLEELSSHVRAHLSRPQEQEE